MIQSEMKGNISLSPAGDLPREIGARAAASASNRFVDYLKHRRFDELFESHGGFKGKAVGHIETKETIGVYRQSKKNPVFVVKAGQGICGSLNYLAGLYAGTITRSGKTIRYARKRNLIKEGWKAWGGERELIASSERMLERMIKEAEEKLES